VHDRIAGWTASGNPSDDLRIEPEETADPHAGQQAGLRAVVDPRSAHLQETCDVGDIPQAVVVCSGGRRTVRGPGANEHVGWRLLIGRFPQAVHGAFFSVTGVLLGTGRATTGGGGREAGEGSAVRPAADDVDDLHRSPFLRCSCHSRSRRNSSRSA